MRVSGGSMPAAASAAPAGHNAKPGSAKDCELGIASPGSTEAEAEMPLKAIHGRADPFIASTTTLHQDVANGALPTVSDAGNASRPAVGSAIKLSPLLHANPVEAARFAASNLGA
jgi:hypothetical protein